MPCYSPIPAYQKDKEQPTLYPKGRAENMELPCGRCLGCKTDRAVQWARRCSHEAGRWDHNIFVTLTYDDEHLPRGGHLDKRALQLFLKRLRKAAETPAGRILKAAGHGIRFFACGEYGDIHGRPHYHACLFNCGFADAHRVASERYDSPTLNKLWPWGKTDFGTFTAAAATYVAQYTLKKQRREWYEDQGYADEDGVWHSLPPPFLRMSLRPAIGLDWLKRYASDLQHGYLVADGRKGPIPRYYLDKLKEINPELREQLDYRKQQHRMVHPSDSKQPERRTAAEQIHKRKKELTERRTL